MFAPVVLIVIGLSGPLLLAGCGLTGALYLPTDPAAAHRAGLPKSLWPFMPSKKKENAQPGADQNQSPDPRKPVPATPAPPQEQP